MDLSHSTGPSAQELLHSDVQRGVQAKLRQTSVGAAVGLLLLLCVGAALHGSTLPVRAETSKDVQLSDIWTLGRSSWDLKCGVKNSSMMLLHNNLGGHGPDEGSESLVFAIEEYMDSGAHRNVTVEITATSGFFPFEVTKSGMEGGLGCINQEAGREVSLDWRFLDDEGNPIELHEFIVTFFDIDGESSTNGREYVIAHGDHGSHTFGDHLGIELMEDERGYKSLWQGDGDDNPMDPASLNAYQQRRAVTFLYQDVSKISVTLGSTAGRWPRFSKFAMLYVLSRDVSHRSNESCTPLAVATDAAEEAENATESATLVSGELLMKVPNCLAFANNETEKELVEQGLATATGLEAAGPVEVSCVRRLSALRSRRLDEEVRVKYKLRVPTATLAKKDPDPCKSLNAVAAVPAADLTESIEKTFCAAGISLHLSVDSISRPSILTSSKSADEEEDELQCETPEEQAEAAFRAQRAELEDGARAAAEAAAKAGSSQLQACILAGRLAKEAAEKQGKTSEEQNAAEVVAIAAAAAFLASADKTATGAAAAAAELAASAAEGAELATSWQLDAFAIAAEKASIDAGLPDMTSAATAGSLAQGAAAAAGKKQGEQSFERLNAIAAAAADLTSDTEKTASDRAASAAELAQSTASEELRADAAAIAVAKVFAHGPSLPREEATTLAGEWAKDKSAKTKTANSLGEEDFATMNGIAAAASAFAHWTSNAAQEQAKLAVQIAGKASDKLPMPLQAETAALAAAKALMAAGVSQQDAMVAVAKLAKEGTIVGTGSVEEFAANCIATVAAAIAQGETANEKAMMAGELAKKAAAAAAESSELQADAAAFAIAKVLRREGMSEEDATALAGSLAKSGKSEKLQEQAEINGMAAAAAILANAEGGSTKEQTSRAADLAAAAAAKSGLSEEQQKRAAEAAAAKSANYTGTEIVQQEHSDTQRVGKKHSDTQREEYANWLPWAIFLAAIMSVAIFIAVRRLITVEVRHCSKDKKSSEEDNVVTLLTAGPVSFVKAKPDPIEATPEEQVPLQLDEEAEPMLQEERFVLIDAKSSLSTGSKSREGSQSAVQSLPDEHGEAAGEEAEDVKEEDNKGKEDEKKKEKEKEKAGCLSCIACGKKK